MENKLTTSKISRWLTLLVVVTGSFMSILDLTIINVVMPSITDYFHDGTDKSQWIITGYSLSVSIVLLCSGWFARRYGYKKVYLTGVVTFTIASFLCGIAPHIDFLIAMRMLQGVGSGIIIPLSMSIIAHNFMGRERGLAVGFLIMASGIAVSLGPVIGGYFVEIDKWSLVFKINIPVGIAIGIMTVLLMKDFRDDAAKKFDYIGVALLLIWAPLSLYLLSVKFEWYLLLILITSLTLFVLRMIYATNALIDVQIFRNRDFVLAVIVMLCFGTVLQGGNYILSQYLLHSLHYTAYAAGLLFIPVGIIQGVMAPITGSLTRKYGNRIFILLGLSVILVYLCLSSYLSLDSERWYILLTLCLRGLGIGLSFTALTNLSLDNAKPKEIDSVSGVINTVKQLAGSFSIAIATLLIMNQTHVKGASLEKDFAIANDQSFMAFGVIIIIAIIAVLLIKKKKDAS